MILYVLSDHRDRVSENISIYLFVPNIKIINIKYIHFEHSNLEKLSIIINKIFKVTKMLKITNVQKIYFYKSILLI